MAERVAQPTANSAMQQQSNDFKNFTIISSNSPGGVTRERSFIRTNHQHQQNANKRRSLAFNHQSSVLQQQQQQQQQIRGKPALEIYRPPNVRLDGNQNKLNVHAQEFTMHRDLPNSRSSLSFFPTNAHLLQHSKSSGNMQQQIQQLAARQHAVQMANLAQQRAILVSHPLQMGQLGVGGVSIASQIPLANATSAAAVAALHSAPRVKFAADTQTASAMKSTQQLKLQQQQIQQNALQRSKSLSSADALARGVGGMNFGGTDSGNGGGGSAGNDIGVFKPEIQANIEQALKDPNQLNSRCLMDLANQIMERAVEGRRYALPTSRFCIAVIAKERKETFLEALLNTCRQWYQERDKVLGPPQSIKNSARPRFTAFMAFLTEMFCQLKRRQLQLRTKCDGVPPPLLLLTLLSKCCEDCVKPPVRSLSEIECLFFVLTCIGRDLETHLPQQMEALLNSVRDAFLNSSASAPAIRRTLLQLIELHASRWQLPGNTVLYYYPSSK